MAAERERRTARQAGATRGAPTRAPSSPLRARRARSSESISIGPSLRFFAGRCSGDRTGAGAGGGSGAASTGGATGVASTSTTGGGSGSGSGSETGAGEGGSGTSGSKNGSVAVKGVCPLRRSAITLSGSGTRSMTRARRNRSMCAGSQGSRATRSSAITRASAACPASRYASASCVCASYIVVSRPPSTQTSTSFSKACT